jgi:hypothetical protein
VLRPCGKKAYPQSDYVQRWETRSDVEKRYDSCYVFSNSSCSFCRIIYFSIVHSIVEDNSSGRIDARYSHLVPVHRHGQTFRYPSRVRFRGWPCDGSSMRSSERLPRGSTSSFISAQAYRKMVRDGYLLGHLARRSTFSCITGIAQERYHLTWLTHEPGRLLKWV